MIDSRPDMRQRCRLIVLACLLAGSSPLYAWQDTDEESDTPEASEETAAPEDAGQATSDKKIKKAARSKSLYFLGARPSLKRQQGPAIGSPANILPQPFVPKGSIMVPPAPTLEAVKDMASDVPVVEAEPDEFEQQARADDTALEPRTEGSNTVDLAVAPTNEPTSGPQEDSLLEAGALEILDPSGIAIGHKAALFSETLWRGYARADVIMRLADFAETSGSPSLVRIANKIALSGAQFDDAASQLEMLSFVEARLQLLMRLGKKEGYRGLLAALPSDFDWSGLSRHFVNASLLDGKLGDACAQAKEQREIDDDAYWLRLVAFCEAARGNRAGVDFQLRILEEISDVRPTFYQLIDQILVEAEQPPGAVLPENVRLPSSLRIDLLEATMARLARVDVPELALEGVNPLAIGLMLSLPGVAQEAKTELMGLAVRKGWADGSLFAAFIQGLKEDKEKENAALLLQDEDSRFEIDAIFARLATRSATTSDRALALERVWLRALKNSYSGVAGESLLALSSDLEPSPDAGGVMTRAALVAGRAELAAQWFLALRSQAVGTDAKIDSELVAIAPLMAFASIDSVPVITPELLLGWWQGEADRPDRFERANLLFTLIEALGGSIGDQAWSWLENGPVAFGGTVPAPAHWRRFLLSARNGDTLQTLAYAFKLLSEGGTSAVPASLAGSLVGTIDGLGLNAEARMIATEILISQGL